MIATACSGRRAKRSRLSTLGLGVNPIRQPTSSRPDPVPVTVEDSTPGPSLLLNPETDIEALLEENGITVDVEASVQPNRPSQQSVSSSSSTDEPAPFTPGFMTEPVSPPNISQSTTSEPSSVLPQPEVLLTDLTTGTSFAFQVPVERVVASSTKARISELEEMEGKLESAVLTMMTMLNRVRAMKAELLQCIGTQPKEMSSTGTVIFEGMTNPSISYNKGILLISSTDGTVRVQP